ncbi:fungal-specific transcription factor domain-containing protein [Trichophaea hybrida]|nr:fungal-specific transcription factor domain-containing protein [Trichophaea hybrida]
MPHHQSISTSSHKSVKARHHPYGIHADTNGRINRDGQQMNGSTPGPIRRRISRACDQCNQLRTKCDGKLPCQHCVDFALKCEYARERKKRGKASRKDIQAAAAAAAAAQQNGLSNGSASPTESMRGMSVGSRRDSDLLPPPRPGSLRKKSSSAASTRTSIGDLHDLSQQQMHHHHLAPQHQHQHQHQQTHHHQHQLPAPDSPSIHLGHDGVSSGMPLHFDRMSPFHQQQSPSVPPATNGYTQNEFMMSPHHQAPQMSFPGNGASPISGLLAGQPQDDGSPSWMSLPSPPPHTYNTGIRYPVLIPLLPHISSVIPPVLACDLLDLYFTNPSTSFFQPASPYVLTHIFRRRSFLHQTSPRRTSPALLCAMLWVAAQTCDAPFLTATPTARGRVCQKLLELCISLLRPLVHVSFATPQPMRSSTDAENGSVGIGLGGLGGGSAGSPSGREGVGAAGTLDDVLTYVHLGIVISASEFKAASLRWWHVAWTLARELKLNREITSENMEHLDDELDGHHSPADTGPSSVHSHPNPASGMSEEEREERRRTWWLLYIVDRHLALCYNRPLALLDVECEGLFLPLDDITWQNGDFYGSNEPQNLYSQAPVSPSGTVPSHMNRTAGPIFEITGCSLYQFFLPLMAILGQVVDLHHARNRPKFGSMLRHSNTEGTSGVDDGLGHLVEQITAQLDVYERSLQEFEAANIHPVTNDGGIENDGERRSDGQLSDMEIQTKIAVSYGTHVMHVLHILVTGKWDPISMLDDNDLWISSTSFISSTAHAVSAAEAISNILKYDPDLSFMPYFFGIYLLQGSFLLLLIADKLQGEASEAVVTACETIVRAHEVCVVTLNTEYQRNFRKVMRSALNQVRGRGAPEDVDEQKLKRREVLQLYRWCGNGTGLAL